MLMVSPTLGIRNHTFAKGMLKGIEKPAKFRSNLYTILNTFSIPYSLPHPVPDKRGTFPDA
jgi:hypothetical protein